MLIKKVGSDGTDVHRTLIGLRIPNFRAETKFFCSISPTIRLFSFLTGEQISIFWIALFTVESEDLDRSKVFPLLELIFGFLLLFI